MTIKIPDSSVPICPFMSRMEPVAAAPSGVIGGQLGGMQVQFAFAPAPCVNVKCAAWDADRGVNGVCGLRAQ